jgi:hypothetical protein
VEGDDQRDLWRAFYQHGQGYTHDAEMLWPAFYPDYLQ